MEKKLGAIKVLGQKEWHQFKSWLERKLGSVAAASRYSQRHTLDVGRGGAAHSGRVYNKDTVSQLRDLGLFSLLLQRKLSLSLTLVCVLCGYVYACVFVCVYVCVCMCACENVCVCVWYCYPPPGLWDMYWRHRRITSISPQVMGRNSQSNTHLCRLCWHGPLLGLGDHPLPILHLSSLTSSPPLCVVECVLVSASC